MNESLWPGLGREGPAVQGIGEHQEPLCRGCRYLEFDRPTRRSGAKVMHYCTHGTTRWGGQRQVRRGIGEEVSVPEWCPFMMTEVA